MVIHLGKTQLARNVAVRNNRRTLPREKADHRARRTKIFIQNALVELLERQQFDKISVQDISKKALINRATFYRYYNDKYHLVEEIFKAALHKMAVDLGPPLIAHDVNDNPVAPRLGDQRRQAAWVSLFEHFAANSRMYTALMSGKGSAWFQARMRDHMTRFVRERMRAKPQKSNANSIPIAVAQCLFANAIIAVAFWWLEGGMKFSASQVATWFRRIAYSGYIAPLSGIDR